MTPGDIGRGCAPRDREGSALGQRTTNAFQAPELARNIKIKQKANELHAACGN